MPHYRDGTEAKIGDIVKGKGYNVKDKDGNLKVFQGVVVGVTPGAQACNIKIAHLRHGASSYVGTDGKEAVAYNHGAIHFGESAVFVDLEYGQCDHFEKVA